MGASIRKATVSLFYDNVDITVQVAPYLTKVSYTDSIDKADDLQVTVRDNDARWRGVWAPKAGATFQAKIYRRDEAGQVVYRNCGKFVVDEPEYDGVPAPSECVIKATSASISTALRAEVKNRAWESVTLKDVAQTIAGKNGLTLSYLSTVNPTYSRIDQRFATDLSWLKTKAQNAGLRLKVVGSTLAIFSQDAFDSLAPVRTFTPADVTRQSFRFGTVNGFKSCIVKWHDANAKATHVAEYVDPNGPKTGQTLRVNERCESNAAAMQIAQSRLQAANRGLNSGEIDIVGDPLMASASTVGLLGFGSVIDGKWSVEEAKHELWPYATSLTLRKVPAKPAG